MTVIIPKSMNWNTERFTDLPQVPQLVRTGAGCWTRGSWRQDLTNGAALFFLIITAIITCIGRLIKAFITDSFKHKKAEKIIKGISCPHLSVSIIIISRPILLLLFIPPSPYAQIVLKQIQSSCHFLHVCFSIYLQKKRKTFYLKKSPQGHIMP